MSPTHLLVEVVGGAERGRVLRFKAPGRIVLGRAGTPDLRLGLLTDPSIRGRHLTVSTTEEGGILVERLAPAGSSRIGGKDFEQARLSSGALLELGDATLRLTLADQDRVVPGVPRAELSDFTVVEEIGQGAFSRVYEAVERSTGRPVALKRLRLEDQPSGEILISAFLREIETAAALDHPCIAKVYAAGRRGEDLFLAMEFLDGPDLDASVRIEGPLPEARVLSVARDILSALDHAHARGVIHRDVKPSNVMLRGLGDEAQAVLVDFGLAIDDSRTEAWGLTRTGDMRGTPDFLAPECLLDARAHSVRSDVFGAGATLCFALTGRSCRSADGAMQATAEALLRADPMRVQEIRPDVSPRLAEAVERALELDPAKRWPSATAMLAALA